MCILAREPATPCAHACALPASRRPRAQMAVKSNGTYGIRHGIDLDLALSTAVSAALEAGEIIRKTFRTGIVDKVKTATDPVTETDLACEAAVQAIISKTFPAHAFLGEEESGGSYNISDDPTWVCDPVDGTANFLHGIELTCVCIGLVVNKKPLVGVVYNPVSRGNAGVQRRTRARAHARARSHAKFMHTCTHVRRALLGGRGRWGVCNRRQRPPDQDSTFIGVRVCARACVVVG